MRSFETGQVGKVVSLESTALVGHSRGVEGKTSLLVRLGTAGCAPRI